MLPSQWVQCVGHLTRGGCKPSASIFPFYSRPIVAQVSCGARDIWTLILASALLPCFDARLSLYAWRPILPLIFLINNYCLISTSSSIISHLYILIDIHSLISASSSIIIAFRTMSTPEGYKADSILQEQPAESIGGIPEPTNHNRDPPSPQDIRMSPRDSESDIPFPFDSRSSIDEESGNRKTGGPLIIH